MESKYSVNNHKSSTKKKKNNNIFIKILKFSVKPEILLVYKSADEKQTIKLERNDRRTAF